MEQFNSVIAVITAICSLPVGALAMFVFNWWQNKKTQDLASNDQALKFYKDFVETFKEDFCKLEKDYYAVKEENIRLKAECKCPKSNSEN